MKKILITLLSLIILLVGYGVIDSIVVRNNQDFLEYNSEPLDESDIADLSYLTLSDYYTYINNHSEFYPTNGMTVLGSDYKEGTDIIDVYNNYEGVEDVVLTDESGSITYEFEDVTEGFYHVKVHYYPYPGKSSSIERAIYINGEIPFEGAANISFPRIWGNKEDVFQDVNGNDIRPSQVETPFWTEGYVKDHIGYVEGPYEFYFESGTNTITLESIREPLMISKIELVPIIGLPSYETVLSTYETNGYEVIEKDVELFQAEDHSYSTSPTLYPLSDRTSARTVPASPTTIKLNTIGGRNWRVAGDKITWELTVEEAGLYEISMRVKQKQASGMTVSRNIYINDEIPFEEMMNYQFEQSNDWRIQTLGNEEEAYLFYLNEGVNTISMEVSLGQYGPIIGQVQSTINELSELYREILVYTGPEPDQFRDYQLTERVDNLIERLETERDNLVYVKELLYSISGGSEKTGILDTVIIQLDDFIEKPREIHKNLLQYNNNISSLGTLVLLLNEQPLEIDYFVVHNGEDGLPRAEASFFEGIAFDTKAFFATFRIDYSSLGETDEFDTTEEIEVWLSVGRDQANILRKMIDESFTPETGIKVDLKLVQSTVLLPATLSGDGPDVAMGLGNNIPVNYAMRNAVYDLSQFDDFDEITPRFKDSAMVPYEFEGGYYALPEQQIFMMMFYRTDIFEELGLTPPETWEDVIALIPDLQKHNLEFYLPIPISQGTVMNLPPNPVYSTLFYQNDGEFYLNGNTEAGFNEGAGPEVFEMWCEFYTDYSFPVQANFLNRFRSGQMPIGLTYYNVYNQLSVFAPEIRGKWDFLEVPGTIAYDEDGNEYIRRETVSSGTGVMIMDQAENKEAAWEYLKWWTSTDIQVQFGRELEGILGAAARYPTANVDALTQLPWTVEEYSKLESQWNWVRGIPEVPGGYMTGRHLDNAFRLVYNDNSNPKETIYDYVQIMNDEIDKKRKEFGLE